MREKGVEVKVEVEQKNEDMQKDRFAAYMQRIKEMSEKNAENGGKN